MQMSTPPGPTVTVNEQGEPRREARRSGQSTAALRGRRALAGLVRLEMQPALALERRAERVPGETRVVRDVVQGENDALFHALQSADVEAGIRVAQQQRQVGRAPAHQ